MRGQFVIVLVEQMVRLRRGGFEEELGILNSESR